MKCIKDKYPVTLQKEIDMDLMWLAGGAVVLVFAVWYFFFKNPTPPA